MALENFPSLLFSFVPRKLSLIMGPLRFRLEATSTIITASCAEAERRRRYSSINLRVELAI